MTGFDHVEHSATRLSDLSDLSDFCQSWPDLNGQVSDRRLSEAIGDEDLRELVAWMRRLCDRVSREGLDAQVPLDGDIMGKMV